MKNIFTALIGVSALAPLAVSAGCGDSLSVQTRSFQNQELRNLKTIAVVDFAGDFGRKPVAGQAMAGQAMADMLTMELMKAGYQVVERDKLRKVVEEQKMGTQTGQLDITESERLTLLGRNLTADLVITGELVKLTPVQYVRESEKKVSFPPATCEVTARAVDAKNGRVVWTCVVSTTATARNGEYIKPLDWITESCAELVESLRNPNYGDKNKSFSGSEIDKMRKARMAKT